MTQLAGDSSRDVKSRLFSRNARCFKHRAVDACCAAGGPSAYSLMAASDGVLR